MLTKLDCWLRTWYRVISRPVAPILKTLMLPTPTAENSRDASPSLKRKSPGASLAYRVAAKIVDCNSAGASR